MCVQIADYVSKGQRVCVHVQVARERPTILWLKLTGDHVPGEQYTMQIKFLHMGGIN